MCPPHNRINFFHFAYIFAKKCTYQRLTPPNGLVPPQQEILDPPLVMDPFDWTKDKAIYQRWKLWSEKARLALDAMEGDSEKTKISYFHHWINGEGMGHIESWKNKKILIHQSEYDGLEEHQKEGK